MIRLSTVSVFLLPFSMRLNVLGVFVLFYQGVFGVQLEHFIFFCFGFISPISPSSCIHTGCFFVLPFWHVIYACFVGCEPRWADDFVMRWDDVIWGW